MYHDFTYETALAASLRAQWKLDDVLGPDQELDFSRNFLPESLSGTGAIPGLSADERRMLNQICAYQYLFLFGAFEEFVVPFVLAHVEEASSDESGIKDQALLNFAEEEQKHIRLFERYRQAFDRGFPVPCRLIKNGAVLPYAMKIVHPLSAAMFVLLFEWMSQSHYLDSVRDDTDIDPLFKSLLKHHWMEEAQHAKLDTLIIDSLIAKCPPEQRQRVVAHCVELFVFVSRGLQIQAGYNLDTFEQAIGRKLPNRNGIIAHLHRVAVWAFIGCGLVHPRFQATAQSVSPEFAARFDGWARNQFAEEISRIPAARMASRRARATA